MLTASSKSPSHRVAFAPEVDCSAVLLIDRHYRRRSAQPGAPYSYVTTARFLALYGFESLRDLPDMDQLEQAGLLGKVPLAEELRSALGMSDSAEEDDILEDKADDQDIL